MKTERTELFRQRVAALAPLLGGLALEPINEEYNNPDVARLIDPADPERGLTFWLGSYPRDGATMKAEVSCRWPQKGGPGSNSGVALPRDLLRGSPSCPQATVSLTRPAQTLANDIRRRVLDPYDMLYKQMREQITANVTEHKARNAKMTALHARIDPKLKPKLRVSDDLSKEPQIDFGEYNDGKPYVYGDIQISSEGFRLNVRDIDAAAVLSCLNAPEVPK